MDNKYREPTEKEIIKEVAFAEIERQLAYMFTIEDNTAIVDFIKMYDYMQKYYRNTLNNDDPKKLGDGFNDFLKLHIQCKTILKFKDRGEENDS
tara:strand:- start:621 stop:902 length:282 start_codon:yes stop_codon:yes gene_type:complete